jgi:polysaccharide biosynthesis protein PslG
MVRRSTFRRALVGMLTLTLITLFASLTGPAKASPPPPQVQYFPETGQSSINYYWQFWKTTPDALRILGFPISAPFLQESFSEPGKFYRVQYYERAVLEEHPELFGQQENKYYVLGRLLGSELAKNRQGEVPFQKVANPGDNTWFGETGHTLRNSPAPFRAFWQKYGALSVFGYPISEQFQEQNFDTGETYWVQYFQRNRMEWHPNESPEYQVLLGRLGAQYAAEHPDKAPPKYFVRRPPEYSHPEPFVRGFNANYYYEPDKGRISQLSLNAGIPWIRQQVPWQDHQSADGTIIWGELDKVVTEANAGGIKLLISVVRAPSWATPNGRNGLPTRAHFPTFANFMGQMAARYKGKVQAYEIWNEQNLAHENGGRVADATFYVDMLALTYDAIKAADPYAIVVSGGPATTETNDPNIALSDVTFMRQMVANPKFRTHVDVVGVHPGGHHNPPDTMWPDRPGPFPSWQNSREFYFRRVEDIRKVMVDGGMGDRQIWITEFGWATANNTPGYEYGNNVSFDQQALYAKRAFEMSVKDYAPWLGGAFLWNLNFAIIWGRQGNPLHEQAAFGVLNPDWSPRPAYLAIQSMAK